MSTVTQPVVLEIDCRSCGVFVDFVGMVSTMRLTKDPKLPVWTMEAQTPEEEDFLADVLDALVMKFPPSRPRGTPHEMSIPKRPHDRVTHPCP